MKFEGYENRNKYKLKLTYTYSINSMFKIIRILTMQFQSY